MATRTLAHQPPWPREHWNPQIFVNFSQISSFSTLKRGLFALVNGGNEICPYQKKQIANVCPIFFLKQKTTEGRQLSILLTLRCPNSAPGRLKAGDSSSLHSMEAANNHMCYQFHCMDASRIANKTFRESQRMSNRKF